MTLAAAQVIDAVAARLVGATTAGTRVHTSRAWPLAEADLPAWRVTAEDETVEPATVGSINEHSLSIAARGIVRAVADLDDALHALAEAALTALFVAPLPHRLRLEGIEREMSSEGEAAVGAITLHLRCTYYVKPAAPGTIL